MLLLRPRNASYRDWHATLLIRFMVGAVFLAEDLQKFIYPDMRGPGRFEGMGFPNPEFWGLLRRHLRDDLRRARARRPADAPGRYSFAIIMLTAIITTKIPILLGHGFGPFEVRELSQYGFWSMAHEMRTDWAMLLGALFLLIAGGGPWSLDALLTRRPSENKRAHDRTGREANAQ